MSRSRREQLRSCMQYISRELTVPSEPSIDFFEDALSQWINQRCYFRDRCWGGVSVLHRDYFHWCTEDVREVPCSLSAFTEWLRSEGFHLNTDGLAYGLVLKQDLVAAGILHA
jgi:hypothetical protein